MRSKTAAKGWLTIKAMSKEEAIEQLVNNRGTQFHPDIVDVFMTILQEEDSNGPVA